MKILNILFILIIIVMVNCKPFKESMVKNGGEDGAINNAILDFTSTSNLLKLDSIFSITVEKINNEIICVSILGVNHKLLMNSKVKVGINTHLPSRYKEIKGRLFYWQDNRYPFSDSAFSIFKRYNILVIDKDDSVKFIDYPVNDSKKGVHYFFCKNNLGMYKKVTTSVGRSTAVLPNLKCFQ